MKIDSTLEEGNLFVMDIGILRSKRTQRKPKMEKENIYGKEREGAYAGRFLNVQLESLNY